MPTSPSIEREAKLGAWPGFELPDLRAVVPGGELVPTGVVELDATYHDTPDLRLARRGITLRYRTGEGAARWTLKLPAGDARPGIVLRRHEVDVEAPGPPAPPPPELVDLVAAHVRTAVPAPVARLRTRRRRFELRSARGTAEAEVADDEVEVVEGADEVVARFREVEVELLGEDEAVLAAAVAALRAAGAGPPDQVPKLVRALGPRALEPPELVEATLAPSAPAVDLVRSALTAAVRRLVDHDHVVRRDDDPEGVHRARVGLRQLRSHLRTFGPLLAPGWPDDDLVGELRWVAAALGEVRDADVLGERLAAVVSTLAPGDAAGAEAVLARLRAQRAERLDALLVAMRSRRYAVLLDRLVALAGAPALTDPDRPAVAVATELARRPWQRLRRAARALDGADDGPDGDHERHRLRILVKRARYACTAVAPVAEGPAAELADALADLQGELGGLQDAVVAEAWLRAQVTEPPSSSTPAVLAPSEAMVLGLLVAAEQQRATAQRRAWRGAWQVADDRARSGWLR